MTLFWGYVDGADSAVCAACMDSVCVGVFVYVRVSVYVCVCVSEGMGWGQGGY